MASRLGKDYTPSDAELMDTWLREQVVPPLAIGVFLSIALVLLSWLALPPSSVWSSLCLGIAASIVSALLLYILISWRIEPRVRRVESENLARFVGNEVVTTALEEVRLRFTKTVPTAVFTDVNRPTRAHNVQIFEQLRATQHYTVKATSGSVAAVRIRRMSKILNAARPEVELLLLDPLNTERLRLNARMQRRSLATDLIEQQLEKDVRTTRKDIYVTLVMLYDAWPKYKTRVYLHSDPPYFRAEFFDQCVMLSYYTDDDRNPYKETYRYERDSASYAAYWWAVEMTKQASARIIEFGGPTNSKNSIYTPGDLETLLTDLGCSDPISELRLAADERESRVASEMKNFAGIGTDELF